MSDQITYGTAKVISDNKVIGECKIQAYQVSVNAYGSNRKEEKPRIMIDVREPDPINIFDAYDTTKEYDLIVQTGTHVMKMAKCTVAVVENYNGFSNKSELHITLVGNMLETLDGVDRAIDRLDE